MITADPARAVEFAQQHALGARATLGVTVAILLVVLLTGQELARLAGVDAHRLRAFTVATVPVAGLLGLIVLARFVLLA